MLIEGQGYFKIGKALKGDKVAICEVASFFADRDDWDRCIKFLELLEDNPPDYCEKELYKATREKVSYENMLSLIAFTYEEAGNYPAAYRWYQKHLDYMDFKHASRPQSKWHKRKKEERSYKFLNTFDRLDRIENRFMLKWEQELLHKKSL